MSGTLIRSTNWIGDAALSVAAVREVRRLFPGDALTIAAVPWVAPVFEGQGLADEVLRLDPADGWKRLSRWRSLAGRFHRVILFPNSFRSACEAWLTRAPQRIGYRTDGRGPLLTLKPRPRFRARGHHQAFYYLDLLHRSGLAPLDYLDPTSGFQPDTSLRALPEWEESAAALLAAADSGAKGIQTDLSRPLVVIHAGAAYGSAKRWFAERFAAVADRLIEDSGCRVALVGSASERAVARQVENAMRQAPIILAGKTDLPTLMGLIASSSLFLSNDSGPMHLAAGLGVRQVSIFGSTDEIATGPRNPRAVVIHKHVECSPCLLRECPLDLRCFDRIRAEEVARAAEDLLENGP